MDLALVGALTGVSSLVVTCIIFVRDYRRRREDKLEARSQFYLDASVKGYEEARKLLADGNNDRVTWIQAARALKHAQALSKGIVTDHHQRLLELHRIDYRVFFHQALEQPAAFFFGAKDASVSTDAAAAESTAPEMRFGRHIASTGQELSPKSLYAIWEAAQWRQDFKDPLDDEFSDANTGQLFVLFPGLHEFLEHRKMWNSAAGKLYPAKPRPESPEVQIGFATRRWTTSFGATWRYMGYLLTGRSKARR